MSDFADRLTATARALETAPIVGFIVVVIIGALIVGWVETRGKR